MIDNSVTSLYKYLYDMLYQIVTPNVYIMNIPTELTQSDKDKGFIVIMDNPIEDNSEFPRNAYGEARVNITCFIPPMKRGRTNMKMYERYEKAIARVVANSNDDGSNYTIDKGSLLEYSDFYNTNSITFNMLIKSYNIIINNKF